MKLLNLWQPDLCTDPEANTALPAVPWTKINKRLLMGFSNLGTGLDNYDMEANKLHQRVSRSAQEQNKQNVYVHLYFSNHTRYC
jgi:hypothetical protein